jgi:hypothetical protein
LWLFQDYLNRHKGLILTCNGLGVRYSVWWAFSGVPESASAILDDVCSCKIPSSFQYLARYYLVRGLKWQQRVHPTTDMIYICWLSVVDCKRQRCTMLHITPETLFLTYECERQFLNALPFYSLHWMRLDVRKCLLLCPLQAKLFPLWEKTEIDYSLNINIFSFLLLSEGESFDVWSAWRGAWCNEPFVLPSLVFLLILKRTAWLGTNMNLIILKRTAWLGTNMKCICVCM